MLLVRQQEEHQAGREIFCFSIWKYLE